MRINVEIRKIELLKEDSYTFIVSFTETMKQAKLL